MSQVDVTVTTAKALGKFREELISEGFSNEVAEQLALDWGRNLAACGATLKVGA